MKSLGGTGKIVSEAVVSVEEALRYVFSLPISTLVSGIDSEKVLEQNLKIVREFRPMTAEEKTAVEAKVRAYAGDGRFELFKSSKVFDGPFHRKQHGFATAIELSDRSANSTSRQQLLDTRPPTSVSRSSRPLCRKVSCLWSRPIRCRIVAWMSLIWARSSIAMRPASSVAPTIVPPLTPPPAIHMVKPVAL